MITNDIINTSHNKLIFKSKNNDKMSYLDADYKVNTSKKTKPLPPKGHLVKDTYKDKETFFFKDINYELKSLKNGIIGDADDHQLGRLDGLGLKISGLLIATYLASITQSPKNRIMEYLGFGAFISSINLYPKLFINIPAKLIQGFDINKQYIDDKGRKKSVFQDCNYIPFDMYDNKDLAKIGDKLGIPRDIKNRNEIIQTEMKKIAIQNNTLWMLTAGFATPVMTALICCGLENIVSPALELYRNRHFNNRISQIKNKISQMSLDIDKIKISKLSKNVEAFIKSKQGQNLSQNDHKILSDMFTQYLDSNLTEGIRADLDNIFNLASAKKTYLTDEITIETSIENAKKALTGRNQSLMESLLIPDKAEIKKVINKFSELNSENYLDFKQELSNIIEQKIGTNTIVPKEFLDFQKGVVIESILKDLTKKETKVVTEDISKKIIDFAKIIGDFKQNKQILDKCKSFKIEYAPETALALTYENFEKTLFKILGFSYNDLKMMKESSEYTQKVLDKNLTELCKDEKKYEKAVKKLSKIMITSDKKLNSDIMTDLINSIENNYNNTALRINNLDAKLFSNTIDRLIKEEPNPNIEKIINSKSELFDLLDGTSLNKVRDLELKSWESMTSEEKDFYTKYNSGGKGSSKNLEITRIIDRYKNVRNTFNRILHTLDVYKRSLEKNDFSSGSPEKLLEITKKIMLNATTGDYIQKFDTVNNQKLYKEIVDCLWSLECDTGSVTDKGVISSSTHKAITEVDTSSKTQLLERFQMYITKMRNIIGNNKTDFTKPYHIIKENGDLIYAQSERTDIGIFNLTGQNPVDFVQKTATKKFGKQKWLRIMFGVLASVISFSVIAQFTFGKSKFRKKVTNTER